jgi:hypothetical protein
MGLGTPQWVPYPRSSYTQVKTGTTADLLRKKTTVDTNIKLTNDWLLAKEKGTLTEFDIDRQA